MNFVIQRERNEIKIENFGGTSIKKYDVSYN